jgi:nicotinate-nucleotide pyrophosphorylase (carboxylating)
MIDEIDHLIDLALREDVGPWDVTTSILIDKSAVGSASITAKEELFLSGMNVFSRVFQRISSDIKIEAAFQDGDHVPKGTVIARLSGPVWALLSGERTALNFVQRLSGIATLTRQVIDKVKTYPVRIVDTRKTTPGWRTLEKEAVRAGKGANHRFGLYDGVLIKDNHIRAAGSITKAVALARSKAPLTLKIEVEVETLAQVDEALAAKADIIMLDNMNEKDMRAAVKTINSRALVEASGGITLKNLQQVAQTGVDVISMGVLTTAARAVDISLDLE